MYLSGLKTEVSEEGDKVRVTYYLNDKEGVCEYIKKPSMSKVQPGIHLLLVSVNMVDIIDEINKVTPLREEDFIKLQMEIREDSLNRISS